jgi:hypothetical protein
VIAIERSCDVDGCVATVTIHRDATTSTYVVAHAGLEMARRYDFEELLVWTGYAPWVREQVHPLLRGVRG